MQQDLETLVAGLNKSPVPTNILSEITWLLKQVTDESLSNFVSQSLSSLLILERWIWELFGRHSDRLIVDNAYHDLVTTLALFNKNLIFHNDNIDIDTKASLIFSVTIDQLNTIFRRIEESTDDNSLLIAYVSLWFDNHSYFLFDKPQCTSPIADYVGEVIIQKFFVSKQYKLYLTQLRQESLPELIFTHKFLFYIPTCSFYFYSVLIKTVDHLSFTSDDIMQCLYEDYLQIIHVHSYTIASWSKPLLKCIAQLISVALGCCWWDGKKKSQLKIIFPTEKIICDHIEDLMRIISYKPFSKQIQRYRSNDETILIISSLSFLVFITQTMNINYFFRFNSSQKDSVLFIAETTLNDEAALCGYGILCEMLTDEELKDLKIGDNISDYFLNLLEISWHDITKQYKHIPIIYLLTGMKNNFIIKLYIVLRKLTNFLNEHETNNSELIEVEFHIV